MIKVIAVDDEPLSLRQLETYISKVTFLQLKASCQSALEAKKIIETEEVDAMFLDINMPDLSGMELVKTLKKKPLVVFTTAYSQYAIEGFRVDAVDYLLKPFSLDEFVQCANKLKERFEMTLLSREHNHERDAEEGQNHIFFKTDYKIVKVKWSKIQFAESMSEYMKIFIEGEATPIVVLMTMNGLLEKLPKGQFMRIHRSYIVNLSRIRQVKKSMVTLDSGRTIPVGDSFKKEFKEWLGSRNI